MFASPSRPRPSSPLPVLSHPHLALSSRALDTSLRCVEFSSGRKTAMLGSISAADQALSQCPPFIRLLLGDLFPRLSQVWKG